MYKTLESSYKGKKVFITGHTGFKGSWLLKILSILGADIAGYALTPNTDNDLYNLIDGDSLCDSTIADLRDKDSLHKAILDFQPDFIFHLAAQPLVKLSYDIPAETFEINAIGTANVLGGVKLLNKPCSVVLITTDKVYHNYEWVYPYRESDRLGGYDPYSASKACTELIIDSYRNSFFNKAKYDSHRKGIAVARAGNVIGGGDWSNNRLIPDIAKAFGSGNIVSIRNPNSVRPWQHVLEPLGGYLLLGKSLVEDPKQFSQAYNFGPNSQDALSVLEMVDLAIVEWKGNDYKVIEEVNQPHEAGLLMLDISKASKELKWSPKFSAKDAIESTISWYKEFYNNKDYIIDLTVQQINNFIKK